MQNSAEINESIPLNQRLRTLYASSRSPCAGVDIKIDATVLRSLKNGRTPRPVRRMTKGQVAKRDKWRASYHEAGHAVIFTHFGANCDVWIAPNKDGSRFEKYWIGQAQALYPPTSGKRMNLCGLAGAAAEALWEDTGHTIDVKLDPSAVSATDCEVLDDESLNEETIALVRKYWDSVTAVANNLFERENVGGFEIYQICQSHGVEIEYPEDNDHIRDLRAMVEAELAKQGSPAHPRKVPTN